METESNKYHVEVVLADVVRVAEGKLDALGIGWQVHNPNAAFGVGIIVDVPWTETNRRHHLSLALEDADGHGVMAPSPDGGFRPFVYECDFEVGRPPGIQPGTAFSWVAPPLMVPPHSLGLKPGKRYTFTAFLDSRTEPGWRRTFTVLDQPPLKMAG